VTDADQMFIAPRVLKVAQMLGLHEAAVLPKRAIQVCVTSSCFYLSQLCMPDP